MNDNKNLAKAITEVLKNQSRAEDHAADILNVIEQNAQHRSTRSLFVNKSILIISFLCLIIAFLGSYKVYFSESEPSIKTVWFDRQRQHSNEGFKKVDEKYPAAFEVWQGKKLIERWHWKIDSQVKTHQFDNYILRCVALYDEADEYIGFTQTIMDHYPSENAGSTGYYKANVKENSIKFTLNLKENYMRFENDNFGILWMNGKLKHTYELSSNFKHNYSTTNDPHQIIEDYLHYAYIRHLSNTFTFLNENIIEPYNDKAGTGYSYALAQYKTHRLPEPSIEAKLARALYKNDVNLSKLNAALAYIHDDLFYWKKVNIDHLGERWQRDIVERLEFKPVLKNHLFQKTEGPIGKLR